MANQKGEEIKQKLGNLKNQIADAIHDGVTLEVSSMLVDGISGRKMPDSKMAFFEIAQAWANDFITFLSELKVKKVELNEQLGDCLPLIEQMANAEHFKNLVNEQQQLISTLNKQLDWEALFTAIAKAFASSNEQNRQYFNGWIHRLQRKEDRLFSLFSQIIDEIEQNKTLELKDKQELRKMWELRNGYIFAQNTVQLDGDVVAKYNARLFRDKAVKDKIDVLIQLHQNNVATGIKQWRFIFNTIAEAIRAISVFRKVG